MEVKTCRTCNAARPVTEFPRLRSGNPQHSCKDCVNARNRAYYAADPATYRAYAATHYWKDPEAQRERARNRDREATREASRRYREIHSSEEAERIRAWKQANTDRIHLSNARRRAQRQANAVETVHRLIVLERADGICGVCGEDVDPLDFHVDHIVPLSLGGEHSYANTQPAHPTCNYRKGAKVA